MTPEEFDRIIEENKANGTHKDVSQAEFLEVLDSIPGAEDIAREFVDACLPDDPTEEDHGN